MKQHISTEQLNELSEEGKERLREWIDSKEVFIEGSSYIRSTASDKRTTYFMNIGQLIEFLDEHSSISIMGHQSQWHGGNWYWNGGEIPKELTEKALEENMRSYEASELVDALWGAVREILEKLTKGKKRSNI